MAHSPYYDVIVVGAGSGGTGAAITAARQGMRVLWIEKESRLGGTGVNAYVNSWQPAYCSSQLAQEMCKRLMEKGNAHYITRTPSGIYRHTEEVTYEDSLRREPLAAIIAYAQSGMDTLLREMAAETDRVDVWDNTTFLDAHTRPGADGTAQITTLEVQTRRGRERVAAPQFIDATADIHLARKAGCSWTIGKEAKNTYQEPSAPTEAVFRLNGWSLCFLIQKGSDLITGEPGEGPDSEAAHIGEMPGGGYYVNMCFQIPGEVGWAMGKEQAREYLLGNIFKRWPRVQRAYGLEEYGIVNIAPRIGVREGPRLVGQYVLNENDFRQGNFGTHHDDCVAFCDHAMDSHLPGEGCTEAPNGVWGVPFRCLQPKEVSNLLVASRGASFSSLAASACRLQRTMIELGEAAGHFAATGKIPQPALPPYQGWG